MRNVKMVQILCILLCLLGYNIVTAQSDYIVTAKGDTIAGKIKYLNFGVEKKIHVVTPEKKKVYSILEVKAFKLDDEVYHTVRTNQNYTFMKVKKSGYLTLYSFQLPNQVTWDGSYLLKADGSGIEVPTISFKKIMTKFLDDCPAVSSQIKEGNLSKSKLNEIIDRYNECIQSNTVQINAEADVAKNQSHIISTWEKLEKEVSELNDLTDKANTLEMIREVKSKIGKSEKIPNFLIEAIKGSLKDQSSVQPTLTKALEELNN